MDNQHMDAPERPLTRRSLLAGAGAVAATALVSPLVAPTPANAQDPDAPNRVFLPSINNGTSSDPTGTPAAELVALNRMAYGPRPGDVERVREMGLTAYIDEQLNPTDNDPVADAKLAAVRLEVRGNEQPFQHLNRGLAGLWALTENNNFELRTLPAREVRAATWVRALYSQWQLREVMVEFWHNHFNVNVDAASEIAATFPLYDRIMRDNCFGNFRTLLEQVGKSIAMQYYLNNVVSKGTPPNENYARELFELHTLGSDNYLNDLYDEWRLVPGALDTPPAPIGYIDEDVYEAARAFTGWTIANGARIDGGGNLPDTGEFYYYADWHDRFQKRVLATEIRRDQAPEVDGQLVLDLVAYHPGTARHLCTKLCRRLVADDPPASLVDAAVAVWMANQQAPDQIKQVLRTILTSAEFRQTWGQKVKRPYELLLSYLRATDADATYTDDLRWRLPQTGYLHFHWPTPTGHPDTADYWLSTSVMVQTWKLMQTLGASWFGVATFDFDGQMPASVQTSRQIVEYWLDRLLHRPADPLLSTAMLDFMRQAVSDDDAPLDADAPPDGRGDDREWRRNDYLGRLETMIQMIAMSVQFQVR